jgi:hypothetical protein
VLIILPNRESRTGIFGLSASRKLINQLEEIVFVLAVLVAVSATVVGVRPVASVISEAKSSGVTGIIEYRLKLSCPIFLGTLVTR